MRTTWINAGEMFWLRRPRGGAALLVNDGFTQGSQGVYEFLVSPDGDAEPPRHLLDYTDESPRSTAVVALDDERYGVVMLRYPAVDMDQLELAMFSVQREAPTGKSSEIDPLFSSQDEQFLGGVEPPQISAISGSGWVDVAWTPPSLGGRLEVLRIARNPRRPRWTAVRSQSALLPPSVLPLSGDCMLWPRGPDERTVRVGFESFAVGKVDASGQISTLVPVRDRRDVPIYAFGDELLVARYGELQNDASIAYHRVRFAILDPAGNERESVQGALPQTLELNTATPFREGALIAPFSDDPSLREIGVGWVSAKHGFVKLASIARSSAAPLNSARAFATGDKVYVAWSELHDAWLDLWLGVADIEWPAWRYASSDEGVPP